MRGAHVETNAPGNGKDVTGNSLVMLDGGLTSKFASNVACSDIELSDVIYQGIHNQTLATRNTGDHTAVIRFRMIRVSNQSGAPVTVPWFFYAPSFIDCRLIDLDVAAQTDVVVRQTQVLMRQTKVVAPSVNQKLDALPMDATIFVEDARPFASSGTLIITTQDQGAQTVNYKGKTAGAFTGCNATKAKGTMGVDAAVVAPLPLDTGGLTKLRESNADLLPLDVRMFGAVPDTPGGADAIQVAIDEFIAHPDKYSYIWIPTGHWYTTRGLLIGRLDGQYVRCIIRGGDNAQFSSPGDPGFGGAVIVFDPASWSNDWKQRLGDQLDVVISASKNTFVLAVQAGNGVAITGVGLIGGHDKPTTLAAEWTDYRNLYDRELADWIDPAIRTNRWSPHALFVVDPFTCATTTLATPISLQLDVIAVGSTKDFDSNGTLTIPTDAGQQTVSYKTKTGTTFEGCSGGTGKAVAGALVRGSASPGGDPANRYPGWEQYYVNTALKTINVLVTGCWGRNGYIGTALSPAGFGNGESIVFRSCGWGYCTIAHAFGQSQSRGIIFEDERGWSWCYVGCDSFAIGQGNGTPPVIISGAVLGGGLKYMFNVAVNTQQLLVTGMYCEATMSIGRVGYGGVADGAKFSGCTFLLMSAAAASNPNDPNGGGPSKPGVVLADAPFHLLTAGLVQFDGCSIGSSEDFVLRIDNRGPIVFRDTHIFYKTGEHAQVPVGFSDLDNVAIERVILLPNVEVMQEHSEWSRWSWADLNGLAPLKMTKIDENTGRISLNPKGSDHVIVGDLIGGRPGSGYKQYVPSFIDPPIGPPLNNSFVPWGVVTHVVKTFSKYEITIGLLAKGVPFDADAPPNDPTATGSVLQVFRWNVEATDGGVLSRGSLYARGASNPIVGDAVYVSTDGVGVIVAEKADPTSPAKMPAVGIVAAMAYNGTNVRVVNSGEVQGYPVMLTPGTTYYVDDKAPGRITATAPADASHRKQIVGIAKNATTLIVSPCLCDEAQVSLSNLLENPDQWRLLVDVLFGATGGGSGTGVFPSGNPVPIDPGDPFAQASPAMRQALAGLAIANLSRLIGDASSRRSVERAGLSALKKAIDALRRELHQH